MRERRTITSHISFPRLPSVPAERSPVAFARHSWLQARRLLWKWARDPATTVQALVYPALTLLMLDIVLGDRVTSTTGTPSIYGTTSMITIIAAMTGSIVSALGLKAEARAGLLARFWTMPTNRAAPLAGRIVAESIRMTITTALILLVGFGLGFRFNEGPVAAIGLLAPPLLVGVAFAVIVTALATLPGEAPLIEIVSLVITLLMFFNTGFVPLHAYPEWLQNIVGNQPMSCAIDTMKALTLGGPVMEPLLRTVAWSAALVLVFGYPAIRGFRRAAAAG